jgi:hypothetical protein
MIKVNEYFDGDVKSLRAESEGQEFTVGIVSPGIYNFSTEKNEHITVTLGQLEVKLPGTDWQKVNLGETIMIPAKMGFQLRADLTSSYLCMYKRRGGIAGP